MMQNCVLMACVKPRGCGNRSTSGHQLHPGVLEQHIQDSSYHMTLIIEAPHAGVCQVSTGCCSPGAAVGVTSQKYGWVGPVVWQSAKIYWVILIDVIFRNINEWLVLYSIQRCLTRTRDQNRKSSCGEKTVVWRKIVLSPQWEFIYWQDGIFILNQPCGRHDPEIPEVPSGPTMAIFNME